MPRSSSLADYYRAHGEAFRLAQELGCTPKEAECELARRAAQERWAETRRRLQAKMAPRAPFVSAPAEAERDDQPWMMRD